MTTDHKYEHLVQWIRDSGGMVDPSVYLDVSNPDNRALKVNTAQRPGAILMSVPDKCTIGGKNTIEVCMNLLREFAKGRESFYYPFINTLPTPDNLSHLPLYKFTRADLPKLQKTSLQIAQQLNSYFDEVEKLHTEHMLKANDLHDEYKRYHYALYMVALYHSRAWEGKGFIPLLELTQHENNLSLASCIHFTNEKCLLVNQKYLKKGEELAWCYTLNTNLGLYVNYGIPAITPTLLPSVVFFDGDKDSDVVRYQKECFKVNNINTDKKELKFAYTENGLHHEALMVGRILQLNDRDLGYLKSQNDGKLEPLKISDTKIVSMRNELAMIKVFLKQLMDYKSSMDQSDESAEFPTLTACIINNKKVIDICIKQLKDHWASILTDAVVDF